MDARAKYSVLLAALLAFVGGVALAASGQSGRPATVVASGYDLDAQSAAFRVTLSSADTLTTAGILATPEFVVLGKQTIALSGRFSVSGATCKARLAYVFKADSQGSKTSTTNNYIKGYSQEFTLTAGTTQFEGAYYPAPDQLFDTEGCTTCRVLITGATSSGTVDFWPGSY